MKNLLAIPFVLFLCGCHSAVELIAPEYKVVKAPEYLYDCQVQKKFPNPDTLTDQQVGKLILKLQENNNACKKSLESIKKFYDDADNTVSKN